MTVGDVQVTGNTGQVVVGVGNVAFQLQAYGPTVLTPYTGPPPPITRRPAQQPVLRAEPEPVGFGELAAEVRDLLAAGTSVQLHGEPGSGKSRLLHHVLGLAVPAAEDVILVDARHRSLDDLWQLLFGACYDAGDYRPGEAELSRRLADVAALIAVDHVGLDGAEVDRLLAAAPRSTFLLASAERTLWRYGQARELPPLSAQDAMRLVVAELGRELAGAEIAAARTACAEAAGNPLRVLQYAAFLRLVGERGLARAAERAHGQQDRLALLVSSLGQPGYLALGMLVALGGPAVPRSRLPALTGVDAREDALSELVQARLVLADDGWYRPAPGVAAAVRAERAGKAPRLDTAGSARRLTGWIGTTGTAPVEVAAAAGVIVAVVRRALADGHPGAASALARAAAPALALSGRPDAWGQVLLLGLQAARAARAADDEAYFLHESGVRALCQGDRAAAAAALTAAAALWQQSGHLHGAAAAHQVQAEVARAGVAQGAAGSGSGQAGVLAAVKSHLALTISAATVVVAGAGGAAFVATRPDRTVPVPTPPRPAPVAVAATVALQDFQQSSTNPPYTIRASFPTVRGLPDPAVQQRVNAGLRRLFDDEVARFRTAVTGGPGPVGPGTRPEFTNQVRVLLNTPRLLSIRYENAEYLGGAVSSTVPLVAVVDLTSGRFLRPADLLRPAAFTAAGRQRLASRIAAVAPEEGCGTDVALVSTALAGSDRGGLRVVYALSAGHLEITFGRYAVGPGACGSPTFRVPYADLGGLVQPAVLPGPAGSPVPGTSAPPASPTATPR